MRDLASVMTNLARASSKRIMLDTMSIESYRGVVPIMNSVLSASSRGVDTTLIYDRPYSYFDVATKHGHKGVYELRRLEKSMAQAHMKLLAVGETGVNPFAGRHHTKTYIFDDYVLTGGGANLVDDTFGHHDYMLRYDDPDLADRLYDILPKQAKSKESYVMTLDDDNEIIFDGGVRGKSLILDRAIEVVDAAKSVVYVSKMLPHPRLAEAIRRIDHKCYYRGVGDDMINSLSLSFDIRKSYLPDSYNGKRTIHAKLIVVTHHDGSMEAISGSHNFNQRGVDWGTQEMALVTRDQRLCEKLLGFTKTLNGKDFEKKRSV